MGVRWVSGYKTVQLHAAQRLPSPLPVSLSIKMSLHLAPIPLRSVQPTPPSTARLTQPEEGVPGVPKERSPVAPALRPEFQAGIPPPPEPKVGGEAGRGHKHGRGVRLKLGDARQKVVTREHGEEQECPVHDVEGVVDLRGRRRWDWSGLCTPLPAHLAPLHGHLATHVLKCEAEQPRGRGIGVLKVRAALFNRFGWQGLAEIIHGPSKHAMGPC